METSPGLDIALKSASYLTAALRARELGALELLDHQLARVERLNARLNAVVTLDADRARAEARLADERSARGDALGPLHGLPLTIKDVPSTVAPVGATPEGLPVGVQIIGPYLEDLTTIDFASMLADGIGGYNPPPGFE